MKVTVTSSGFDELQDVLDAAADDAVPEGRKVVSKGSLNIKRGAQRRASGISHAPHYPHTIDYDVTVRGTLIDGEIGPNKAKGGQAHLGHIFEYGIPQTPPRPHLGPELDLEAPRLEKAAGDMGERLLQR